jgi:hypothetical protein
MSRGRQRFVVFAGFLQRLSTNQKVGRQRNFHFRAIAMASSEAWIASA